MAGSYTTHNSEINIFNDQFYGRREEAEELTFVGQMSLDSLSPSNTLEASAGEHAEFIINAAKALEALGLYDPQSSRSTVVSPGQFSLKTKYFEALSAGQEDAASDTSEDRVSKQLLSILVGCTAYHVPRPETPEAQSFNRSLEGLGKQALNRFIYLQGSYSETTEKVLEHSFFDPIHCENYLTKNRGAVIEMAIMIGGLSQEQARLALSGSRVRCGNLKNFLNYELPKLKQRYASGRIGKTAVQAS